MIKVLMSLQPKWCAKILNREKTIEVRRVAPKLKAPYEVLIYCTKEKPYIVASYSGVVENEKPYYVDVKFMPPVISEFINGKVVGKFTVEKVEKINYKSYNENYCYYSLEETIEGNYGLEKMTGLNMSEIHNYLNGKNGYALHISNLQIFDKPKELGEFYKCGYNEALKQQEFKNEQAKGFSCFVGGVYPLETLEKEYRLTKAPQSFMYVEVGE